MIKSAILIDDHPVILESLHSLLSSMQLFYEVYSFSNLPVHSDYANLDVSLAIIDLEVNGKDGRSILRDLLKTHPTCKIIFFSSHDDPKIIQNAMQRGAHSYLLKSSGAEEIKKCVQEVMAGNTYIGHEVQSLLNAYLLQGSKPSGLIPQLSKREMEVLQAIASEKTSHQIAEELFISEHTVEGHRAKLFQKLDVKNAAGLIRKAFLLGLLKE